jgi:hypothetical protein
LQKDVDALGEWALENEMKIYSGKRKALGLNTAQVKELLNYSLWDQVILGDSH